MASTRPGTSDSNREQRIFEEMIEGDAQDRRDMINPKGNNNIHSGPIPKSQQRKATAGGKHRYANPYSKATGGRQATKNANDKKGGSDLKALARKAAQKVRSIKKKNATTETKA